MGTMVCIEKDPSWVLSCLFHFTKTKENSEKKDCRFLHKHLRMMKEFCSNEVFLSPHPD